LWYYSCQVFFPNNPLVTHYPAGGPIAMGIHVTDRLATFTNPEPPFEPPPPPACPTAPRAWGFMLKKETKNKGISKKPNSKHLKMQFKKSED